MATTRWPRAAKRGEDPSRVRPALYSRVDREMELKPRELSLPVWAQEKEWFTIPGPHFEDQENWRNLYILERDGCSRVCVLFPGDVLLIGRARKK